MAAYHSEPAVAATSYDNVERIGFGLLMIGAPILMLGAAILHPPHAIENGTAYYHAAHDHTTAFYVSHTLFILAAVLFVPAVGGLVRAKHPLRAYLGDQPPDRGGDANVHLGDHHAHWGCGSGGSSV